MSEEPRRTQVGKIVLTLALFEELIRLDGVQVIGVSFDPIQRDVTIGVESVGFPDQAFGWPVEECFLEPQPDGRLRVRHPRVFSATEAPHA